MSKSSPIPLARPLALGTVSFAVCFAAWGLVGALAPRFREAFHLTNTEGALLVATPVLLGALARIPIGLLTDRLGGRLVFTLLMAASALPCALVPEARSFPALLATVFALGIAGSSFAVGAGFVSRWSPPGKQGSALGVYGLGNGGQSAAVFLGPVLAASIGLPWLFRGVAALLVAWAIAFWLLARDAPAAGPPSSLAALAKLLATERIAWVLSAFYFLTFGGFVAFSIFLPTLLANLFGLPPADAGLRAAGFVVLATLLRPVGGTLADRIGGARVLSGVFLGLAPFGLLLCWPSMVPFTVGALGCAALLGLGNGAVFKLVAQHYPGKSGAVSGLVGAIGGLGGFFPPLLLGAFRDRLGVVWPGFLLLVAVSLGLAGLNARVFLSKEAAFLDTLPPDLRRTADRIRAGAWATMGTGLLVASIVVGSRNLAHFDAALVVYTFATVFATWGVIYHHAVWIQKPPTRVYWRRGWELVRRKGLATRLAALTRLAGTHLVAQTFIGRRSRLRWWMHQLLFWGCLLAVAITFPLVFGWIHFETAEGDPTRYVTYLFGFPTGSFVIRSVVGWLLFHGLDVAAVLVLGGIALSLWRRMHDPGARAVQDFGRDFLPLFLLFSVSVTGLALTVSTLFLRGNLYGFLSILHALTVIATLLYLPFGKLFHVVQRPAQLGVKLYLAEGEAGPGATCARCGERFASRLQLDDLKGILPELGFDYRMPGSPAGSWQDLCPPCKRKSLATAQLRIKEAARG